MCVLCVLVCIVVRWCFALWPHCYYVCCCVAVCVVFVVCLCVLVIAVLCVCHCGKHVVAMYCGCWFVVRVSRWFAGVLGLCVFVLVRVM